MGEGHWRKRLQKDKQKNNPPTDYDFEYNNDGKFYYKRLGRTTDTEYPFPVEDNVTWRVPYRKLDPKICGMIYHIRTASAEKIIIICEEPPKHFSKLGTPHKGYHEWTEGAYR